MIVTEIVPLDKRRCKVSMEENFALVLYRGELRKYGIEEGAEISNEQYREIMETVLFKRARERVVYLLKASDKTELQLRKKLEEGGYPQEAADYAISLCKKYGYIDDQSYAKHYVAQESTRKSRRQIQYELQQKGISRQQINDIFESNPPDEERQVRRFLEKKGYWEKELDQKERQKLRMSLMRKGFSGEIVSRVMGHDSYDF